MTRLLLALLASLVLVATAAAQCPEAAIALHVADAPDNTIYDCYTINTQWWGDLYQPLYFYVIVCGHMYNGTGFMGLEYGLTWPADWDMGSFESYADFTIGTIEFPGDGVLQAWAMCQNQLHPYVVGILTLWPMSPGRVSVVESPIVGCASVVDCMSVHWVVYPAPPGNGRAGWVDIWGGEGCNPCPCWGPPCYGTTPVEDATWGTIKSMYR